ncbi:unnamed protein product [Paramecium sonneborni]|uniref:MSP domain-containing protein n=1 Tax=Paramecium sonneborni TaxID=65129 RepID=A0A8S1K1L6_9CILI|nr:unnamed protein product [Paramecium sonneborni]
MKDQKPHLTLLYPKKSFLSFKMKTLPSKDKIWYSKIKIQYTINHYHKMKKYSEKHIAFKVMSNASDLIKSSPFVGLIGPEQIVTIKLIAKEPIFDNSVRIKIISINIDKPQELRDQYEIMDSFKQVKDSTIDLPNIILKVQNFIQSEPISYITSSSDRNISIYLSNMSQLKQNESSPKSGFYKLQLSSKQTKDSLQISQNFQIEQSIQILKDQQQTLINEIRELNKQIVQLKAEKNISSEEDQDDQIKFTLFQLIILAIVSLLMGFYFSEN